MRRRARTRSRSDSARKRARQGAGQDHASTSMHSRLGPLLNPEHDRPVRRSVITPGRITQVDWIDDSTGGGGIAPLLCVYTGHRIRDGQLLIEAMEAQGWSGTIRIQKRGHPLTSASLEHCFAFKVFSFTSDLRAAMWSLNGRQPWRLLGGMKVYTHSALFGQQD